MEVNGDVVILCKKFNTKVVLRFREQTFWSKENVSNGVEGELIRNDDVKYKIRGKWTQQLRAYNIEN